jgi:hypothetical protein
MPIRSSSKKSLEKRREYNAARASVMRLTWFIRTASPLIRHISRHGDFTSFNSYFLVMNQDKIPAVVNSGHSFADRAAYWRSGRRGDATGGTTAGVTGGVTHTHLMFPPWDNESFCTRESIVALG